jgi:hypothetical protein
MGGPGERRLYVGARWMDGLEAPRQNQEPTTQDQAAVPAALSGVVGWGNGGRIRQTGGFSRPAARRRIDTLRLGRVPPEWAFPV